MPRDILGDLRNSQIILEGIFGYPRKVESEQLALNKSKRTAMPTEEVFGLPSAEQEAAQRTGIDARNSALTEAFRTKRAEQGIIAPTENQVKTTPEAFTPPKLDTFESQRDKFSKETGMYPNLTLDENETVSNMRYKNQLGASGAASKVWYNPKTFTYSPTQRDANDILVPTSVAATQSVQPIKNDWTNDRAENNRDFSRENQWRIFGQQMRADPRLKKLFDQGLAADSVRQLTTLVKEGNTVATPALGVKIAKAMGEVGVLTDEDVVRYIRSGKFSQAVQDKLSMWAQGKPTDATLDEIAQITDILNYANDRKLKPIYDEYVQRGSANYGVTPEESARQLGIDYQPPAPQGGAGVVVREGKIDGIGYRVKRRQ